MDEPGTNRIPKERYALSVISRRLVVAALGSMALVSSVGAAELRGRLVGADTAEIVVQCEGTDQEARSPISPSGNYAVRGLPAGRNCTFQVVQEAAKSASISFNTSRSLSVYSGTLRVYGAAILVTRQ